jgi:hypothetical protein
MDTDSFEGAEKLRTGPKQPKRGPKRRPGFKVYRRTMDLWKRHRYSIENFITDYLEFEGNLDRGQEFRVAGASARKKRHNKLIKTLSHHSIRPVIMQALDWDHLMPIAIHKLEKELDSLIGLHPFDNWSTNLQPSSFNTEQTIQILKAKSPLWWLLWDTLLRNTRAKEKPVPHHIQPVDEENEHCDSQLWTILTTAVTLRKRARKRANSFITNFSIFLHGNAVRQRVMDVLGRFGLVLSRKTLHTKLHDVEQASQVYYHHHAYHLKLTK